MGRGRYVLDGVEYRLDQQKAQQQPDDAFDTATPLPKTQPASAPAGDAADDIVRTSEATELGQSLGELNKDELEGETRMSGIDMRARLHPIETSGVLALDALVSLQVFPQSCLAFTRQKKRLSVSESGKGRSEIVEIVAGKREQDAKKNGLGGFMSGMMGGGGGGGQQ